MALLEPVSKPASEFPSASAPYATYLRRLGARSPTPAMLVDPLPYQLAAPPIGAFDAIADDVEDPRFAEITAEFAR